MWEITTIKNVLGSITYLLFTPENVIKTTDTRSILINTNHLLGRDTL
jgi:hypothetical protein